MSKGLKKLMKKIVASDSQETLAVADAKLGNVIKSKTDLDCVYSSNVMELMRCIRSQMPELVAGGDEKVRFHYLRGGDNVVNSFLMLTRELTVITYFYYIRK